MAKKLMTDSGIDHKGPCSFDDLDRLATQMAGYRVRVYSSDCSFADVHHAGAGPTEINLLLHRGHYSVITSLPSFFGAPYWCEPCQKPFHKKRTHVRCGHNCPCCYETPRCVKEQWIRCHTCNRLFVSETCYDNHRKTTEITVVDPKTNKRTKEQKSTCTEVCFCLFTICCCFLLIKTGNNR